MSQKYYLGFACATLLYVVPTFCQGDIVTAHQSTAFDPMLDPNLDGFITASGALFSSGTTEAAEFEMPTHAVSGWIEIFDVSESGSDVTPSCSNVDISGDADGGGLGFWTTTDPTPGSPSNGDEHIVFRIRIANNYSGNFGYNFLLSTDGLYGSGIDANAIAGNQGFEYEVQFSSGGNKQGVSGWNVDGLATNGTLTCSQCVALADVQEASAAAAGGCTSGTPTFISFAFPLSYLGIGSDINPLDLFIGLATASSGNNTSILGGGNVKDYGAFDDSQNSTACPGLTGPALFDCLMDQAHDAQQTALPIELLSFDAEASAAGNLITWLVGSEENFDHYEILSSPDGRQFTSIQTVYPTKVTTSQTKSYQATDAIPFALTYYRLKSVDLDGTTSYSTIVAVDRSQRNEALHVYPNPTSGWLNFQSNMKSATQAIIFNPLGQTVISIDIQAGQQQIDLSPLRPGSYFLALTTSQGQVAERIRIHKR